MFILVNKKIVEPVNFELITSAISANKISLTLRDNPTSNPNISIIFSRPSGYFLSRLELISINYTHGYSYVKGKLAPEIYIKDKKLLTDLFIMEM